MFTYVRNKILKDYLLKRHDQPTVILCFIILLENFLDDESKKKEMTKSEVEKVFNKRHRQFGINTFRRDYLKRQSGDPHNAIEENDSQSFYLRNEFLKEESKENLKKVIAEVELFYKGRLSEGRKPIATTILLKLVDQRVLDLDKPVNNYLKSWQVQPSPLTETSPVTLRYLASHSSGMTVHGFPGYATGQPLPTVPQILNGLQPANTKPVDVVFKPGTKFQYSGGGFCVIQLAITETTKMNFESLAQKYIFQPTLMSRSTFEQPLSGRFLDNVAEGHLKNGAKIKGGWHTYPELAAAGLWTTPSDLLRWAIALAKDWQGDKNSLLSSSSAKEMLTPQLGDCGLGIFVRGNGNSFCFNHGGANAGYRSFLLFFPLSGDGIAIMCNSDGADELLNEVVSAVITEYGWK